MNSGRPARPRIAYITADDSRAKRHISGIPYYIGQALQKHCGEVTFLGPAPSILARLGGLTARIACWVVSKLRTVYDWDHDVLLSRRYARFFKQQLDSGKFDVIVAAGCAEIAFLETRLPILYYTDTTFARMLHYYPDCSRLLWISKYEGNLIERKALEKARLILNPTRWAAASTVKDYGIDRSRVRVLPLGANLDEIPPREVALNRRCGEVCVLLWIGRDWERKGGEIAFQAMLELEWMGIPAELVVCGCVPPKHYAHKSMTVIAHLDKEKEADRRTLDGLFRRANFLLLPTRADTFGIVFCEASAYGLPSITTETGGVPEVVINGENGYLLPMTAAGKDYALLIARLFRNRPEYAALARTSRDAFEKRLNWDLWGIAVGRLVHEALGFDCGAAPAKGARLANKI